MANFEILHFVHHSPPDLFPRLTTRPSPVNRTLLAIAYITIRFFVESLVEYIATNVMEIIERDTADDGAVDAQLVYQARCTAIKKWRELPQPLRADQVQTQSLIRALLHHPPASGWALKTVSATTCTYLSLASAFFDVVMDKKARWPLQSGSPIVTILLHAGSEMRILCRDLEPKVMATRIRTAFTLALIEHAVERLPAPLAGSRNGKIDCTVWQPIAVLSQHPGALVAEMEHTPGMTIAPAQAQELRQNSSWNTSEFPLRNLADYMYQTRMPVNWDLRYASLGSSAGGYVAETYDYIHNRIDIKDPVHHLIIFISIVVSKMCHRLRHDKARPFEFTKNVERQETHIRATRYVRASPWLASGSSGGGKKGHTDGNPFLIMFSVYALALLDPGSPLRRHMEKDNNGLGTAWTNKHGSSLYYL
jgi:hypothetical protein